MLNPQLMWAYGSAVSAADACFVNSFVNGNLALKRPIAAEFYQPINMLRILVDARKIGDGGIGTYIENLLLGLSRQPGVVLSAICPKYKQALLPAGLDIELIDDPAKPYSLDEYFGLAKRIDQNNYDLVHFPHFTLPYGFHIPSIVTVHDLIHLKYPQHFFYPLVARPLILSSLRRASKIITVSQASRLDILNLLQHDQKANQKISVIPNAVDLAFASADQTYSSIAESIASDPYILGVYSNNKPHKGLQQLLQAFSDFKSQSGRLAENSLGARLKLVLVGKGVSELMPVHADIVSCGEVAQADLISLYKDALAVVLSSRIEGFGLPVIEAHAAGTPVISTPVPAILELLDQSDIVCHDFSAAAITDGLRRFVATQDPSGIKNYKVASKQIIEKYSQSAIAEKLLQVYRSALI